MDISVGTDVYVGILLFLDCNDIVRSVSVLSKRHRAIVVHSRALWKLLYKRDAKVAFRWKGVREQGLQQVPSWREAYKISRKRKLADIVCEFREGVFFAGFSTECSPCFQHALDDDNDFDFYAPFLMKKRGTIEASEVRMRNQKRSEQMLTNVLLAFVQTFALWQDAMFQTRILFILPEYHYSKSIPISISSMIRSIARTLFSTPIVSPGMVRFEQRSLCCLGVFPSPTPTTGIFIHCGQQSSYALCIYKNEIVDQPQDLQEKFYFQSLLGGRRIANQLTRDLRSSFGGIDVTPKVVDDVLRHHCFVRAAPSTWNPSGEEADFYGIPFSFNGRTINLVRERWAACEQLFTCDYGAGKSSSNSSAAPLSLMTLVENVVSSAKTMRPGISEEEYLQNIVLSGSGLNFTGVTRRLKRELRGSLSVARTESLSRSKLASSVRVRVRTLPPPARADYENFAYFAACAACERREGATRERGVGTGKWVDQEMFQRWGMRAIFAM